MGKLLKSLWISLCLLVSGVLASPVTAECSKTLVVNQAAWKPYMYRDESGAMAGLDHDLVKAILDLAGCNYVFVEHPSNRALVGLANGEIDLVVGASITPDRQDYGRFTRSYRFERIVMITRRADRERFPADSLQQLLSQYRVVLGGINGGYYGEEFAALDRENLLRNSQLILVQENERLLSMLDMGRIDAIVGDLASLYVTAEGLGLADRIAVHRHQLNADAVYFLLSRASTSQADWEAIDAAIDTYVRSDEYWLLLRRYGLTNLAVEPAPDEAFD